MVLALSGAVAWAQEDLEQGKTGAQMFASDCAICHKSAQALVKEGYPTEAFLRAHYTSGREMAAALFAYLRSVAPADAAPAGAKRSKARGHSGDKDNASAAPERKPVKRKQASDKAPTAAESTAAEQMKDQPEKKKE